MNNCTQLDATEAVDLAREAIYRFLAAMFSDPRDGRFRTALDPANQLVIDQAIELVREEAAGSEVLGFGELPRDQLNLDGILNTLLGAEIELGREYDQVFGFTFARECPPYETEYMSNSEPFFRSQQLADLAGFYRAFGLRLPEHPRERPDHLVFELEFAAFLLAKKRHALESFVPAEQARYRVEICDDAFLAFCRDHLLWWLPAFATGLRRRANSGLYAALARLLAAFATTERRRLGIAPPRRSLPQAVSESVEESSNCGDCLLQTQ